MSKLVLLAALVVARAAAAVPAEHAGMEMRLPPNTLPMMTGKGPFGPMEMGGMFTIVKVREGLAPGDGLDPGWYRHPAGTVMRLA
jgi:hypothetical protein